MVLSRREFLASAAASAAALAIPGRLLAAVERETPPLPDLSSWAAVRAQFPLAKEYLHFSSFFIASHPKPVRDAIEGYRRALDANPFVTVEHGLFHSPTDNLYVKVCEEVAPYLGAQPSEVALTPNTTTGLALVYHGIPFKAGDEILTTTHDHYVQHECARLAAARTGATVRRIVLYDKSSEANAGQIVDRIRAAFQPRTRLLGVTWVHSSTGVRLPIRAIGDVVAEVNRARDPNDRVVFLVDGVHGLGCSDETIAETGCDFFSAGTHKWMFAPRGTGLLYGRTASWAQLRPLIPSFASFENFEAWMNDQPPPATTAGQMSPGGFIAFEHQWAVSAAFRFHRQIGRKRVADRIRALNDQCKAGLAAIPSVVLHTPRDPALSAGIVCFDVQGLKPEQVVERLLEKKIVASTSPYKVTYARLAPSLVNDPGEVDTAVAAVRALART